ncbi:acetate and butyrate kinase [Artomyces pyxidatus]|uniref:Acetate and butyrate kinase n=1 Tax=Artomyces pyxidatus TaxID=48021 RepID=A0ACB8TFI3_9AGAM|nr:acetate and butyrate kinase [Artomyces pyxidatus]
MAEAPAPRTGLILSLNSGSSSLKISLYRLTSQTPPEADAPGDPVKLVLTSAISGISASPTFDFSIVDPSAIKKDARTAKDDAAPDVHDHTTAFAHFLDYLKQEADIDRDQIVHVCHRIVHGGDYYTPVIITEESYHHIDRLSDLAPLHNGAALSVIEACLETLKQANSIAYFDTAFHHYIPRHISSYAIDQDIANKKGLHKYGFHGLSYAFILRVVSRHLQKPPADTNLIILHLGSGASICAIQNGKSLDTSMGLTPVEGLPGATRSGAIDPTLIFHYTHKAGRLSHKETGERGVGVTQAEEILNKQSGWRALAGTTDFAAVTKQRETNPAAQLAFDIFADRILNYVGAYFVKLGGNVDAVVFSGGIGERSVELRDEIIRRSACLGFAMDEGKNKGVRDVEGEVVDISAHGGQKKVLVCRTDEQLEMARQCALEEKFWL